ncbi:hypothetical protein PJF56_17720 [Roseofilum sp. BLCC_M91]|uniref:CopG family transcriptional regulator n=1 Tax=Roseofilum halophilum BLCC-M91 TaxID=3022259 RepID=A0ABT7BNF4_9CYAN|nr:hypothetical protein [Roseofilum halophilum]MDJ1180701.1 hypothetical protein [Roseofilum halophilum BLCC-M91]
MVKSRKKKITVYLTTENEQLLDEYRQSQGKIQYSRAVNEILGEYFEQQDGEGVEERLGEVEERLFEVEEELTHRRRSPDYRQEIEQLRSQISELTQRCDRLMAINHEQKQAILQAQHRERQFCQQLSQTLETVQTQGTPPSDPQNTTEPEDEAFDILDAELVDNSAEDLLFKLSQELGLI